MRSVSFAQALVVLGCFAAIGLAHFAGPYQGTLVSVAVAYFLWLRQPPSGGVPPAVAKAVVGVFLGLTLGQYMACAPWTAPDVQRLRVGERVLDRCEAEANAAPDGGHRRAFEDCTKDAGMP